MLEWSQTSYSYSPAGNRCRDHGLPQEDEQVGLGEKAVIQFSSDPDEELLPFRRIVIKAPGVRNRGEPLEVTFSDSQEMCLEQSLVLQAY